MHTPYDLNSLRLVSPKAALPGLLVFVEISRILRHIKHSRLDLIKKNLQANSRKLFFRKKTRKSGLVYHESLTWKQYLLKMDPDYRPALILHLLQELSSVSE